MDRKALTIKELELFAGCSAAEVQWVERHADEIDIRSGSTIVHGGARAHEFCVVVGGFAEATGSGAPVALGPGSFFGHVEIMSDRPHAMTVTAKGDVRLLVFEVRAFRGLAECVPSALRKLFSEVASRVPVGPAARHAAPRRLAVAS